MASQAPQLEAAAETVDAETVADQVATETVNDGIPDETVEGEGEPAEGEEGEVKGEPELEPLTAPSSLTPEEKAKWGDLPREAQEVLVRRIGDVERHLKTKTTEMGEARVRAETQAREAILHVQNTFAQEMQAYAQRALPPEPDPRLLQTGHEEHRTLFYRQEGEYRAALAERNTALQQAESARQQAAQVEQAQRQAEIRRHDETLAEALGTEWTDTTAREELLGKLQPIGSELGYPVELMADATATDILALRTAAEWKRDADKWRAANKSKMEVVRAAKQLPRVTQPGNGGGPRAQPNDAVAVLYPNDVRR